MESLPDLNHRFPVRKEAWLPLNRHFSWRSLRVIIGPTATFTKPALNKVASCLWYLPPARFPRGPPSPNSFPTFNSSESIRLEADQL